MKRISHFRFSKSQRSGIFFLCLLVMAVQVMIWAGVFESPSGFGQEDEARIQSINAYIDSVRLASQPKAYAPEPFNPNFMSDYKGYRFGMSPEEIDRLFAFRADGQYVNTALQFQAVTGIHDSILLRMEPYFRFPRFPVSPARADNVIKKQDINSATAMELQKVYGVGPVLAERIIVYRERLGGFALKGQLGEVYGLKEEAVLGVWGRFHLDAPAIYPVVDVNTADLGELAAVPYISMALAAKIVAYRSARQRIDSLGELTKIHNLSENDLSRIQLYLRVE
ncbi:ComEA family DNA-binding protein [Robertkochia flava]|uniref:ComEA family DNA-binding protein n=1 Tax=Robertkochia flava TaxID=3447986 RepID=UPI001CCCE051|nr:helix-hairpin-helix domain-containing protein [Robertkochia marina]